MAVFLWEVGDEANPWQWFQGGYIGAGIADYEEDIEDLLPYLEDIKALCVLMNGKGQKLLACCNKLDNIETRLDFLYSAIRDMRRELLRGMNTQRRIN